MAHAPRITQKPRYNSLPLRESLRDWRKVAGGSRRTSRQDYCPEAKLVNSGVLEL